MNKPVFTFISDLSAAQLSNSFELNWTFPSDLTNPTGTHDPSTLVDYKLYRHIEVKYPSYLANGGPYIDPTNYIPPLNSTLPEPKFKLIATLAPSVTSYTDSLNDLNLHSDEGIVYNTILGKWVDGSGADVLDQIFHTDRRIYYKIVAESNQCTFNRLPFIFLCHTNGVECRSLITQVKWNTLYYEGDTVWFNGDITNCSRTAVDPTIDVNTYRYFNVWVSGVSNTVYCLQGRDGSLVRQYTLPVNGIMGLRVDPDNGDGIAVGSGNAIYRCSLSNGSVVPINSTTTPYAPNGNNGMVLIKEGNDHYTYTITNMDAVAKAGIDNGSIQVIPRTNFGCTTKTNASIPNVLGITNSTDGSVWVNGHAPIHYKYKYSYTVKTTTCGWAGVCAPNGALDPTFASKWNAAHPTLGAATCVKSKHYVCKTTTKTVTVDVDLYFLQDVGYVYGANPSVNLGRTNGQPYPYSIGASYPYKPFTSKNRSGWFGDSPQGEDRTSPVRYGRPYKTGASASVNPKTSPKPEKSQKGLASDLPADRSLTGSTYNIFQTNERENRVHKLTYNGTTLDYNYIAGSETVGYAGVDYWSIVNPVHVCVDEQNNVWIIQENTGNELTLLYQMANNATFPYGGTSRWPSLASLNDFGYTTNYKYGNYFSDPYIEFYLTRDTSFAGLTTTPTDGYRYGFGVQLMGNPLAQKDTAVNWCLSSTNYLTQGKRLYPNYAGPYTTTSFSRVGGDTTEYNSDNIGMLYTMGQQKQQTEDIQHPEPIYPVVRLNITAQNSNPQGCDSDFWTVQDVNDTAHLSASGYDDFQVELSATPVSMGSFYFRGYDFYLDDRFRDIGGSENPSVITTTENVINYIYHDPSISGKPKQRWVGYPGEENGKYQPYVAIHTNDNCYYISGSPIPLGESNTVDSIVWERWPTANFYAMPVDLPVNRLVYLSAWNLSSYSYPAGDNGHPLYSVNRIISGYDPLSAQFNDISITRTWPISTWFWTFGDRPDYLGFPLSNSVIGVSYPHVTSDTSSACNPPSVMDDCITDHQNIIGHVYKGPGTYYATLYVKASNSGTTSWQISAGITDQNFMASSFIVSVSRRIDVLEICPNMSFNYTSAYTVSTDYYDDIGNQYLILSTVSANAVYTGNFSYYGLISGYAPYLKVSFTGLATARSLPFSALRWDFGDPFSDPEASDATRYPYPTAGWPVWNNTPYAVTGEHIFVMPGFYDITLTPVVSAFNRDYVSNCTGIKKHMHVYVQEIYPEASFTNSYHPTTGYTFDTLSGVSPLKLYFDPSGTGARSFGICRIDWDFGDNSQIITISRHASAEYTNYYNTSTYDDLYDPRNIIVSHTYNKTSYTQPSSYTVTMSAYACNTNSVDTISAIVAPIYMDTMSNVEGELQLLENRMYGVDNDLLLVFEGQKSLNNFTILISSERL